MTDISTLFKPLHIGDLELPNRVLMAPLTRNRSQADGTPKEMAQTYYYQRASAGLIVSEATQISAMGKGYIDTPGIHTEAHADAWKEITDAVHAGGGRIFCQLWHVGRISHTSLLPDGNQPVSSSAVKANTQTFTANGFEDCSDPVALDKDGIAQTIEDYGRAAAFARQAGFDGIEVHSANGYLLDQFLQDGVNQRTDEYGGSVENRMRLLNQVLDRVLQEFPANRVGIRLSPLGQANDITDSDPEALFGPVYDMLSTRKLAYLHVVEQFFGQDTEEADKQLLMRLRKRYDGVYIGNGGYDAEKAAKAISSGAADAITFGRPFIANPDLPERFRTGAALNEPNSDTFYGGDEKGYTDYPFLDR
ncbi:N-ethylmaleimide reductase [Altererythrobacter indicus]|uniref:N-ethylmaleimide reductase n=1 Tax=Altericroceibacterium indicum TaxID=374177 RepID=A0A845AAL9_9SPHN|nr:alkene reductase [Altericroceibacterium indicum]MXP26734.1 N-ethylmaleimide reductase [Altericroceibacterium indicum]